MSKHSKILIVDDELNIRRILQMAFEKIGHEVLVAEDAHNALQLLSQHNFDLVITDVTMPGMNGYELQKIVHENQPDVPVIIMTAYGTIPQAVAAIRNGAFEYVTKPFDLDQLKRIVASALDRDSASPSKKTSKSPKVSWGSVFGDLSGDEVGFGDGSSDCRLESDDHDRWRERRWKGSRFASDPCAFFAGEEAFCGC